MKRLTVYIILAFLGIVLLLSGCGLPKIRVASKQDVEGTILAQLIIQYLDYKLNPGKKKCVEIIDNTWMYTTDTLRQALIDGDIDIYPEYTGNGCLWFKGLCENQTFISGNRTEIRKILNNKELNGNTGLTWLKPADVENNWAIVVNNTTADQNNLQNIEDLFNMAKNKTDDKSVIVYGSKAFFENKNAFKLFEKKYGYYINPEQKRYISNPIITESLAASFTENGTVHASMAYTTDLSHIEELDLVMLTDSDKVQPRYYPVPLIRSEIYKDYPDPKNPDKSLIEIYLGELFEKLGNGILEELNAQAVEKYPDEIARAFLEETFEGFGDKDGGIGLRSDRPPGGFFEPGGNTTIEIVNARITVPAHETKEIAFYIDDKFMKTVNLRGWFSVSGGAFNDIKIAVLSDNDYTNWNNFRKTENAVYLSEKVTKTQFDLDIDLDRHESGTYHLVLSNRFSEFSYKEVTLKVYLYFTKK